MRGQREGYTGKGTGGGTGGLKNGHAADASAPTPGHGAGRERGRGARVKREGVDAWQKTTGILQAIVLYVAKVSLKFTLPD